MKWKEGFSRFADGDGVEWSGFEREGERGEWGKVGKSDMEESFEVSFFFSYRNFIHIVVHYPHIFRASLLSVKAEGGFLGSKARKLEGGPICQAYF